jgi:hypothetical protein
MTPANIEKDSYWNYRVVATFHNSDKEILSGWSFTIRDVYYKNGKPDMWGAEPQYPCGENTQDVILDLENMNKAYLQPLLIEVDDKLVEYHKKTAILIEPEHLKKYQPELLTS